MRRSSATRTTCGYRARIHGRPAAPGGRDREWLGRDVDVMDGCAAIGLWADRNMLLLARFAGDPAGSSRPAVAHRLAVPGPDDQRHAGNSSEPWLGASNKAHVPLSGASMSSSKRRPIFFSELGDPFDRFLARVGREFFDGAENALVQGEQIEIKDAGPGRIPGDHAQVVVGERFLHPGARSCSRQEHGRRRWS